MSLPFLIEVPRLIILFLLLLRWHSDGLMLFILSTHSLRRNDTSALLFHFHVCDIRVASGWASGSGAIFLLLLKVCILVYGVIVHRLVRG
jgi:hypothetical protein